MIFAYMVGQVLVASDAAIKGLELRGLPLLVSYDVPKALEAQPVKAQVLDSSCSAHHHEPLTRAG